MLKAVLTGSGLASLPFMGFASQSQSEKNNSTTEPASVNGKRKLGSLEVSSIGLGVQNMHRRYDTTVPYRPDMINIIRNAYDRGVTFFDCAEAYGPHECERILGEAIEPFRDEVVITSKFGWNIDQETGERRPGLNSRPEHIKRVVEGMLKRLRTDRIDLLYQHRVDPEVPVTAVQNEYSLLWRGPEDEVIPTCEELGIGFVPWSPLGVGFLTGAIDENTRFAQGDFRGTESRFSPDNLSHNLALIDLIKQWAERKQAAPGQIALAWLMAQKPWIVPIPGTTNVAHLHQNIGAASVEFTPSELSELNSDLSEIQIQGQRLPDGVLRFSGVEAPPKQ